MKWSPMKPLLDLFSTVAEIDWARCTGGENGSLRPPFIVWRFKHVDEKLDALIVASVRTYEGNVAWKIERNSRNWIIEPEHFASFANNFKLDVDAMIAFGKRYPDETRKMIADADALAEHMRRVLLPH